MVALFLMAGCMRLGLNFAHKTPKQASKIKTFTIKDSLKGDNNIYRQCFDVKHYDIHLKIDPDKKTIGGYITTRFDLVKESKTIQMDLDPQFVIDSIVQNHQTLSYKRKYTAIFIDLKNSESQQALAVYYHGKPRIAKRPPWEGGFVWKKDKNGKPWVGVACEGDGAQTWLAIKSYLGDEPDSVTTHFTVPWTLTAVSNGNFISSYETGDWVTYSWQTSYSINPYNITVYVGDFKKIEEPYKTLSGQDMKLTYYVLPYNFEKAKTHFKQSENILHTYESLFGEYPWVKDGYRLVESPFAGMEHQSAIAYGNGYKNTYGENFDYIILHETAHEWWGNAVSVADFSDVWIHEGLASYTEALYVEKTQGKSAYLDYISWQAVTIMNKWPVILPKATNYWNYKDGDVYNKGSLTMHNLRCTLQNDTLFFKILKTFFYEYKYHQASTEDFIRLVNRETGKDYQWLFDQYFYRRESPLLKWNFGYDSSMKEYVLVYQFDRIVPRFNQLPVKVQQGNKTFYIYPDTSVQTMVLPYPDHISIEINTDRVYLQEGYKLLSRPK